MFLTRGHTCHWSPKYYFAGLCWQFHNFCLCFSVFLPLQQVEEIPECLVFKWRFSMFQLRKPLKVCVHYNGIGTKHVSGIAFISDAVFLRFKQKWRQIYSLFKLAIRKSWLPHYTHKSKHPFRSTANGCGYRTHYSDLKGSDTVQSGSRNINCLPFWVLAVNLWVHCRTLWGCELGVTNSGYDPEAGCGMDGVPSNCMTRQGMTAHIIFKFVALVFL
jgi:hypothetical protein